MSMAIRPPATKTIWRTAGYCQKSQPTTELSSAALAEKVMTAPMPISPAATATIAAELGEASVHSDHYQVLFIIGILLFTITFAVNLAADLVVRGIRTK